MFFITVVCYYRMWINGTNSKIVIEIYGYF